MLLLQIPRSKNSSTTTHATLPAAEDVTAHLGSTVWRLDSILDLTAVLLVLLVVVEEVPGTCACFRTGHPAVAIVDNNRSRFI